MKNDNPPPITFKFEVPGNGPEDLQLASLLSQSLDKFLHLPHAHLLAALRWFQDYGKAKVGGMIEDQAKRDKAPTFHKAPLC